MTTYSLVSADNRKATTVIRWICPICKAAPNQPCLFKVKDGHQSLPEGTVHIERARLDYFMEAFQPTRPKGISDLSWVLLVDSKLGYIASYLSPVKGRELFDMRANAVVE